MSMCVEKLLVFTLVLTIASAAAFVPYEYRRSCATSSANSASASIKTRSPLFEARQDEDNPCPLLDPPTTNDDCKLLHHHAACCAVDSYYIRYKDKQ